MGKDEMNPSEVLEKCIAGEVPEGNALPQLLHIYLEDSRAVVKALCDKATSVLQQSDAGQAAVRAGAFLVTAASFLDKHREDEKPRKKGRASSSLPEASKPLLEHILFLTGGKNRGPRDKATRAQGCTMLASLALQVPEHAGAQDKLLEFSLDKVPSIREKAVRGLAGLMPSQLAESALLARTSDPCTAVRASAVRGLRVSVTSVATILGRIDDIEACVRSQLFLRLSEQPSSVDVHGPAALTRLVAGLADRTVSVRSAAGQAVDAWCEHLGGVLVLLDRCDLMSDEALGETAAAALGSRFPEEGLKVVKRWLGSCKAKDAKTLPDGPGPVLFARMTLAAMPESTREEVLDVAVLVQRAQAALEASEKTSEHAAWQDYLLRQLLHVVALADIADEGLRRDVEKLAEAVLFRGPLSKTPVKELGTTDGTCRMAQSAIDLGIVILRKVSGLVRFQVQTGKTQALEARCSTRVVLLVSEICQPFETAEDDEGEGQSFTTRLSLQIQELNNGIESHQKTKDSIDAAKTKAAAAEEYIQAQKLKDQARKNDNDLARLQSERDRLLQQRDTVCLRVLSIVSALLRWSNSDLRKDPALMGTLHQILLPMVSLPALSKAVEVSVVYAICLFSVRDGEVAKGHWSLMLTLLRGLQEVEGVDAATTPPGSIALMNLQCDRARAAVAARALADCARVHGGLLDRDEVLSAASALAAVPFSSRQVVIEPLCGWLLSLGHIFFEEHLKEPVLEVQWALGWMLVEAFKQRRRDPEQVERPKEEPPKKRGLSWVTRPAAKQILDVPPVNQRDQEDAEAIAMASRLTQFFALLPKLPGKHGAPMLSLALESVAESGLWRRGVLLPHNEDGQTRWLRNFAWPELFNFVHERLPMEMRFRLWRCSLQICVSSPELAPLAEIPFALASAAADAPPGAPELLQEALDLGADPEALGPLCARLPVPEKAKKTAVAPGVPPTCEPKLLLAPVDGVNAENERRAELASLGINIEVWAPSDLEVPKTMPLHHRMRCARKGKKGSPRKGIENCDSNTSALPSEELKAAPQPEAKRRRFKQAEDAPRLPLQEIRQASRKSAEV